MNANKFLRSFTWIATAFLLYTVISYFWDFSKDFLNMGGGVISVIVQLIINPATFITPYLFLLGMGSIYILVNSMFGTLWFLFLMKLFAMIEIKVTQGDNEDKERFRKKILWTAFILMTPVVAMITVSMVYGMGAGGGAIPREEAILIPVAAIITIGAFFFFIFARSIKQKSIALGFYGVWMLILSPLFEGLLNIIG